MVGNSEENLDDHLGIDKSGKVHTKRDAKDLRYLDEYAKSVGKSFNSMQTTMLTTESAKKLSPGDVVKTTQVIAENAQRLGYDFSSARVYHIKEIQIRGENPTEVYFKFEETIKGPNGDGKYFRCDGFYPVKL